MATAEQTVSAALELCRQGRPKDAVAQLRRYLQRQPSNWLASAALGQALMQAGELQQSLFQFQRCAASAPREPAAHNNLGMILERMRRSDEAIAAFQESVRLDAAYANGWLGLSLALLNKRDYEGAIRALHALLAAHPQRPEAHQNLGLVLMDAGQVEEGLASLRRGLAVAPGHAAMRSTLLMGLNYREEPAPQAAREEHAEFGRIHGPTLGSARARTSTDPDRRLRIGVLSSDFREQSVMYFFEPVLEHRDKDRFEYYLFPILSAPDPTTDRLRTHAAGWFDATAPDDAAADRIIRDQRIDILLDLNGHSGANRITILRDGPAPVIISAIGYPNTTGLPAVGYRMVDSLTDPPGSESHATERLVRLDPCFLCYRPPAAPDVAPPPSASGGAITFGSFNALPKLSPQTIRAWAGIMGRVPGSRLVLKATALEGAWARDRLLERLAEAGIARERVELLRPTSTTAEHLGLYAKIDIALDPFPYNGTTTTCEALWMGVPVVALSGDRHAGRVGVSLLNAIGSPELVGRTIDEYARIAVELASDPLRLAGLRRELRPRMAASVLCDGAAYARRFEAALRGAWREWCGQQRGVNPGPSGSSPG